MANRLAEETSPYLLQHADNPVEWLPWGAEALERARAEDRPILLSIGYSACHWCHVMAHESFEDDDTAQFMNDHFVCIKVDREERPDVDAIYMEAVQGMTGHGGWPVTVFMTAAGEPFFAGTYYPKGGREGMPSFQQVLTAISAAWDTRRDELTDQAKQLSESLRTEYELTGDVPGADLLGQATSNVLGSIDLERSGVGRAPKFPQTMSLDLL